MSKVRSFPFFATCLMLIGVGVLFSLSAWQFQRLSWKEEMITNLDAAYQGGSQKPVNFDDDFSFGFVNGIFLADEAFLLQSQIQDGKLGYDVIVPLDIDDGHTLLVNMGWTQSDDLSQFPFERVNGEALSFTGLLRAPSWNAFTPANNPDEGIWYKLDPDEIAAAKGLAKIHPKVLYAERVNYDFGYGLPNNERIYPKNNHLQYALFWGFLGVAMIGVYWIRFFRS